MSTTHVRDYNEAIDAYVRSAGASSIRLQPSRSLSYHESDRGWVLENVRGPLALVQDDGSVIYPEFDHESREWVLPT